MLTGTSRTTNDFGMGADACNARTTHAPRREEERGAEIQGGCLEGGAEGALEGRRAVEQDVEHHKAEQGQPRAALTVHSRPPGKTKRPGSINVAAKSRFSPEGRVVRRLCEARAIVFGPLEGS